MVGPFFTSLSNTDPTASRFRPSGLLPSANGLGGITISQFGVGLISLSQFTVSGYALAQFGIAYSLIAQFGLFIDQGRGQFVRNL